MESREGEDTEMPQSWSASGRSVLKLNIRHLCLFGAWPLSRWEIFYVYGVFNIVLGSLYVSEAVTSFYFLWGDVEKATLVLVSTFYNSCVVVKMALLVSYSRRYIELVRRLDALMLVQSGACSKDSVLGELLWRSRRSATRVTKAMLLFVVSQYCTWYTMPLFANGAERRLPLVQHSWDNNSHHYALFYTFQCIDGIWQTQTSYGIDGLFVSIMILVAGQMKILATRVVSLDIGGEESSPNNGRNKSHGDKVYRDLCLCIDTHEQLLRFVKELDGAMSPIVMTQFACSVLVTCVTLFSTTYNTDISVVFRCAAFLPVPLGQVYLYCWAAHTVSEEAEAVSTAAYGCAWVEANERFKRALRILIIRAQKPLVLTAGHLYPINRAAFVSLMNASYTYYAVLCQINKRSMEQPL